MEYNVAKLPIGIQNFEKLRIEGYKYVDKTAVMYDLVSSGCYYFLSRPRRFGKSLLMSTLDAFFNGKKDLFHGLAVEKLEKNWLEYPVFHLDLNTRNYQDEEALTSELNKHLEYWEKEYGDKFKDRAIEERFTQVIRLAHEKTGRKVVILVDEYDKPILQTIGNEELQNRYRTILKGFYGALKSMDGSIKFALLTGVTKFGKVSVFSDLNNLNDISMDPRYYDICGLTEKEIRENFDAEVSALASNIGESKESAYSTLAVNYDGYHFMEDDTPGIYNPFSILNALDKKKLGSYWFETGTPTYLVELLKLHNYNLAELENEESDADVLNCVDSTSQNPLPVIYQSGYLTIKGYNQEFGLYKLGYPNREVKEGFLKFLIPFYTNVENNRSGFEISRFVKAFRAGDVYGFMGLFKTFLSGCPYELQIDQERHFQSVMYIISTLCGLYTEVETHTSVGRIDMVVKNDGYIYIFEFKFDGSVDNALSQIESKGYADMYASDSRTLIQIGANYNSKVRNIDDWKVL